MPSKELRLPIRVKGVVQGYDWGRDRESSVISTLSPNSNEKKMAELWFGAHSSAPCLVDLNGQQYALDSLVSDYPSEILGSQVVSTFGPRLPFLFKVLSIGSALSIQLHPNKEQAEKLHYENPEIYPDNNHKPEVGCAISAVELLYGFRTPKSIATFARSVPEFSEILGEQVLANLQQAKGQDDSILVEQAARAVFTRDHQLVKRLSQEMYLRLEKKTNLEPEEKWILSLAKRYPDGDVGLFCFFLLNLVELPPGMAVFIGPNIAHAYLSGELVECMASSDNVIRAGLTSKFKDVEALLSMSNYSIESPDIITVDSSMSWQTYATPTREFVLDRLGESSTAECGNNEAVELVFCLNGTGQILSDVEPVNMSAGDALLLPAQFSGGTLHCGSGEFFRARCQLTTHRK